MGLVFNLKKSMTAVLIATVAILSGCASLTSQKESDPFESVNRSIYSFNETADEYLLEPAAKRYQDIMPEAADKGVTNFFSNLDDVVVFINDVLQLKLNQAFSDAGRFIVNSTIGVLGFMDMATDMGMPKHHEDFGQTLGAYGVGTGPYVVLPILGPSTLRDTLGLFADSFVDPVQQVNGSDALWATIVLEGVDLRAGLISSKTILDQASLDPYDFLRSGYFQRREYLVFDGNPPMDDDIFDEDDE